MMAIKRVLAKNGQILYIDTASNRFTNAKNWVKQNMEVIGTGKSKIWKLSELTDRERRSFNARKSLEGRPYRYNGKFLDKETNQTLKNLKYPEGELKGKISITRLNIIKDSARFFNNETFIKNADQFYQSSRGDLMSTVMKLEKYMKQGNTIEITIAGQTYTGAEALKELAKWEMDQYLNNDVAAVRITHAIEHDKKKKKFKVNTDDSQVDLFENTP